MISLERALAISSLEELRALKAQDFLPGVLNEDPDNVQAILNEKLQKFDPTFRIFLTHAPDDVMSGKTEAFQARLNEMSPFEIMTTWTALTFPLVVDDDNFASDDVKFAKKLHALMIKSIMSVFDADA